MFAACLRGAETPSSPPVVELPVFEVKDSRVLPPPESWKYAEIPGFEILSRISERETKRFVRDFLLLQEVIEVIMPGLTRGHVAVPTALILCGGRGKGFDEFLPAEQSDERYGTNSLFFRDPERAAIVIDFALSELRVDADTVEDADPYRAFYIEYFRFLIRRQLNAPPPPWFEEGLVQLFGAVDFSRKSITSRSISSRSAISSLRACPRYHSAASGLACSLVWPPSLMLSSTDIPRNSATFWKVRARPSAARRSAPSAVMSRPSSSTRPRCGR